VPAPAAHVRNAIAFLRAAFAAVPHTSRSLRRAPGFVAIATLSLGAALGMSTSVFALIDAMTHPVSPYTHDEQLFEVRVFGTAKVFPSPADVLAGLAGIPGIDGMALTGTGWGDVEAGESVIRVGLAYPRRGFFEVLGVHPRLGRLPSPAEAGAQSVALVSDAFWREHFGNRAAIADAHITTDDKQYAVVGVLPPHMNAPINASVWIPADRPNGEPYVRLHRGITPKDIQPRLNAIMQRLTQSYGGGVGDRPFAATLVSLTPDPIALKDYHKALIGAAICILLIACANVAALMLARGTVRSRDYALRLAIGASRADIAREVMFEVAALAVIGSVAGAILAAWGVGLITRTMPVGMIAYGFAEPHWSVRVLGLSALAVMIAVGVAGGFPAWRASRTDPAGTLKDSSGGNTARSSSRFRWLVVGELALSMTLLVGTSLMLKSERNMANYDFGFDTKNLLLANVYFQNVSRKTPTSEFTRAHLDALAAIRSVPGVVTAARVSSCEFDHDRPVVTTDRTVEGGAPATLPYCTAVTTGYLATFGYQVVDGRDFAEGDAMGTGAVILDQNTAHRLFPHERAIGRTLKLGTLASSAPWMTVVGVVRDKELGFKPIHEAGVDSSAVMFVSRPDSTRGNAASFAIRTAPGAKNVRVLVSRALRGVLPKQTWSMVDSWAEGYDEALRQQQFLSMLFSLLGGASLALGAAGLFSVVSYLAGQRMREFAVRIALGATGENVAGLVLREALVMSLGGTAIGAALGMKAGFLIWDRMYGVYPVDAAALIAAEATLLVVTMLACLAPALRAMRADPVEVMRAA
jgi:putative ABC transport system permease protein